MPRSLRNRQPHFILYCRVARCRREHASRAIDDRYVYRPQIVLELDRDPTEIRIEPSLHRLVGTSGLASPRAFIRKPRPHSDIPDARQIAAAFAAAIDLSSRLLGNQTKNNNRGVRTSNNFFIRTFFKGCPSFVFQRFRQCKCTTVSRKNKTEDRFPISYLYTNSHCESIR